MYPVHYFAQTGKFSDNLESEIQGKEWKIVQVKDSFLCTGKYFANIYF
jgi:hypothetical protein